MWVLLLNDMRSSKIEHRTAVCRAATREALEDLLTRERVEPYTEDDGDRRWDKRFRKGSILEWFNPPDTYGDADEHLLDVEAWIDGWVARQRATTLSLPEI